MVTVRFGMRASDAARTVSHGIFLKCSIELTYSFPVAASVTLEGWWFDRSGMYESLEDEDFHWAGEV